MGNRPAVQGPALDPGTSGMVIGGAALGGVVLVITIISLVGDEASIGVLVI